MSTDSIILCRHAVYQLGKQTVQTKLIIAAMLIILMEKKTNMCYSHDNIWAVRISSFCTLGLATEVDSVAAALVL